MMRDAFVGRLTSLATEDPRLMLITGDLGFGVLNDFADRFPAQYLNAGVAEQNMTGVATGLAMEGRIVFTYSIANFPILRCLEQIRNDAAYHNANVKVVAIGGGFSYGPLGMSHHATEDIAILRALPVTVVTPGCDWEAAEATAAIAAANGTCYLRLDKSGAGDTSREGEKFVLGESRRLREGSDITLIAAGGILDATLAASTELAARGVECRVISMHTIQPIDVQAIADAAVQTGGLVTIEEHTISGGLGGAVAEAVADSGRFPKTFLRLGIRERGLPDVGSQEYLRTQHGLDRGAIVRRVLDAIRSTVPDKVN